MEIMQHIKDTIIGLRRYIGTDDYHHQLEDVDALLGVALEEVWRKMRQKRMRHQQEDR